MAEWKYTRHTKSGISKWTLGTSWVTRFDSDPACFVGVRGVYIGRRRRSPSSARRYVEQSLRKPKEDAPA